MTEISLKIIIPLDSGTLSTCQLTLVSEGDLVKKTENTEALNMSPELTIIRDSLLLQKSEILNRDNEFKLSQLDVAKLSDEGDQTAQEQQNNISIQLHERERLSLVLIEKTLSKFATGSYGECESCGDEIAIKRLQARPLTPFCINCMEEHEEQSHISGLIQ